MHTQATTWRCVGARAHLRAVVGRELILVERRARARHAGAVEDAIERARVLGRVARADAVAAVDRDRVARRLALLRREAVLVPRVDLQAADGTISCDHTRPETSVVVSPGAASSLLGASSSLLRG